MTPMTPKHKTFYVTAVVLAALAVVLLMLRRGAPPEGGAGPGKSVANANVNVRLIAEEQPAGRCSLRFEDKTDETLEDFTGSWDNGAPRYRIRYELANGGANACANGRLRIPKLVEFSGGNCDPNGTASTHVIIRPNNDRFVEVRTQRRSPGTTGRFCYDVYLEVNGTTYGPADPEIEIVW